MNIADLQLGFGLEVKNSITLNIYVAGCKRKTGCEHNKCHNPQLQDFAQGSPATDWYDKIERIIQRNRELIHGIVFLGGEPLDQDPEELLALVNFIRSTFPGLPVYCYTGYRLHDLPQPQLSEAFDEICAGPYVPDQELKAIVRL